jgi:glycosyltransferase involved in cell wall biosynthesis
MDVQRADVAQLMRSAGVYLHTFAFQRPYGMPISIAESLACGGIPIARDCPAARTYAGTGALYYDTEDEAVAHLQSMLAWTEQQWELRSQANAAFARNNYADDALLPWMLEDWRTLAAERDGQT